MTSARFSDAQSTTQPTEKPTIILVVGAPGTPEYGDDFNKAADKWKEAANRANVNYIEIGREKLAETNPATTAPATSTIDRQKFQTALTEQSKATTQLWIVLIGHGTFDGKEAKFNLRNTDFSDTELAAWLKPITRPIAFIDCSSASAPFLNRISGANRVVITATRAGNEVNYCRFATYFADAVANPAADIDRDGQTSLLEAFLTASRGVADFYAGDGRLATEHALLDDNGDALGSSADFFQGTRATAAPRAGRGGAGGGGGGGPTPKVDGTFAHQWFLIPNQEELSLNPQTRAQRNDIEQKIESLRQKKSTLPEKDYYAQLDALLLSLAHLQIHENPPVK